MTFARIADADPRALLLRRLEQEIARGELLAASEVALLVGRHAGDLVQDSVRARETRLLAPDLRLQSHLYRIVQVMALATRHSSGVLEALYWYRTARLPTLDNRTPEDATADGSQSDVCRSLALRATNDEPEPERRKSD